MKPTKSPLSAETVDEIGDLERELLPFKAKAARLDHLKKFTRLAYDKHDADTAFEAKGARFAVLIGPKAVEQSVNVAKLARSINPRAFFKLASVTLKALRLHLMTEEAEKYIDSEQTGPRTLKVVEKGKAA